MRDYTLVGYLTGAKLFPNMCSSATSGFGVIGMCDPSSRITLETNLFSPHTYDNAVYLVCSALDKEVYEMRALMRFRDSLVSAVRMNCRCIRRISRFSLFKGSKTCFLDMSTAVKLLRERPSV